MSTETPESEDRVHVWRAPAKPATLCCDLHDWRCPANELSACCPNCSTKHASLTTPDTAMCPDALAGIRLAEGAAKEREVRAKVAEEIASAHWTGRDPERDRLVDEITRTVRRERP